MLLPVLNLEGLTKQIEWAEASERFHTSGGTIEDLSQFQGWGLWDQDSWSAVTACGTAYCQAGQAAVQAGWVMVRGAYTIHDCEKDGVVRPIEQVGREHLGLSNVEADDYFASAREIRDLKALVNAFAFRRGLEPPYDLDVYPVDKDIINGWETIEDEDDA